MPRTYPRISVIVLPAALLLVFCLLAAGCSGDGQFGYTRNSGAFQPLMELDADEPASLEEAPARENPISSVAGASFPAAAKELTVLVYLVGSDLETNGSAASHDLREMVDAQFDAEHLNVVVYTGGAQRWHIDIPNDCNCVLEVTPGTLRKVAQTQRSLNMGEADTLTAFMDWAAENYPSDRTALILWDHGGGPARGFGLDQLFSQDSLTLDELDQAMLEAGYGSDVKLDWVGFDACLMNSAEMLQVWADYARYFVASQDLEDSYGWDYSFLGKIDASAEPADVAKAIVEAFDAFHAEDAMRIKQPNYTLAAVDLSQMAAIEQALDDLSEAVLDDFAEGNFATIARARGKCRSFGSSGGSVTESGSALVDIGDLARRMAKSHPEEAQALSEAVDAAVLANSTNLSGAHGISLYFPVLDDSAEVDSPTTSCGKMLAEYAAQGYSASELDWTFPPVRLEDGTMTIELDAAQNRSIATASYTILGDFQGRGYCALMSDVRVMPDKHGVLRIPADPELIVTSGDHSSVVPLSQVDASAGRQVYRCDGAHVLPGADFISAPYGERDFTLLLARDAETGKVDVSSAYQPSDDAAVEGRADIDLPGYKTLMLYYGGWNYPERADDGTMLPYAQWAKQDGRFVWNELPLDEDIGFETRKVSQMPNDCVLQVVLTDINGVRHASELLPLERVEDKVVSRKTDRGKLVFVLKDGYAELDGYSGSDDKLVVPAKVKGRPVAKVAKDALSSGVGNLRELTLPSTVREIGCGAISAYSLEKLDLGDGLEVIGDGAFAQCANLRELELPDSLQVIGRGAFKALGVEQLRLPASLKSVGEASFTCCKNLGAFEVEDGCRAVMVRDGVLFSADGKTLMAFPGARTGVYKAPKGTETIGYGAFVASKIDAIALPEGIKAIDNCAFCASWFDDIRLSAINLPDSLERIGAYAFGTTYRGKSFEARPFISELRLGKNLSSIGTNAFTGLRVGRFIVDAANESFASPGGFLTNKAGDTVVEVPGGLGQVVVVPDGVTTIPEGAFSLYPTGIEVVMPKSVSRISTLAFPCHYLDIGSDLDANRVYDVVFHCEKDSAAATFAERRGIRWDDVVDPALLSYASESVQDGDVTMTFLVYRDHAVLHDAMSTTRPASLAIPAEVDGVPVTGIDALADSHTPGDAWESVTLPASLSTIDYRALPALRSDAGFAIAGESASFIVKDGVLFSADGAELVAFSRHDADVAADGAPFSYEVPAGTVTIGRGAFYASQLERVTFPKSLRIVRTEAFSANNRLMEVQMNKGLERIEDQAVYCRATSISLPSTLKYIGDSALRFEGFDGFTLPESLREIGSFNVHGYNGPIDIGSDTLRIGPRLSRLGQSAFSSANVTAFSVNPQNPAYSSADGLLMSKDGKTLVLCPAGRQGELRIPAGVEELEPGCLDEAAGITDVYFPDSAMGVDAYTGSALQNASGRVTFHCKPGSAAARYAKLHDIAWVED